MGYQDLGSVVDITISILVKLMEDMLMLISSNCASLNFDVTLVETVYNQEASDYIRDHYEELIGIIRKIDIKDEKARDLLHDVFISIVEAEKNGEGFDMEYGTHINEDGTVERDIMDVSQFVIGRIKQYAKNIKYRTDVVDGTAGAITQTDTYYVTELDKYGNEITDKNGNVKMVKKVDKHKVKVAITASAATFTDGGDIEENNDEFQKAFAVASTADSTDDVAEMLSIREQIDYCIDICELHEVNLVNILKNMDELITLLGAYRSRKRVADSLFSKLTDLIEYHDGLAENLVEIFKFSSQHKTEFNAIMATY